MATILSDEDVFGPVQTSPRAAAPRIPQTGGAILTDAEVFGNVAPPMPQPARGRAPRSDFDIALGGAGAGAKAVARSVADFGDMLLSVPGMAMGSVADVASRIQSFAEGATPREGGRIAKEVRQGITSDFSPTVLRQLTELAIDAIAPDKKKLDPSDVQKGLEVITSGIEKGGHWVEKKTGGVITAETFDSLVNEGMALGGLKGAGAGAKALTPKPKEAPFAVAPEPEVAPPAPPRNLVAQVERATGVRPEPTAKQLEARQKQTRDAFKAEPEYADQLARFAEEEARLRGIAPPDLSAPGGLAQTGPRAARTGSRDAVQPSELPPARTAPIETGAPPAIDSALGKIREGRAFDLTSEERIAMRDLRSQFGRPALVDAQGRPMPSQRGAASQEMQSLIAALGLGTGLAVYAYYNQDDLPQTIGAAAGMIGAKSALGSALRDSGYTLKTLERLPQNRTEFTRQQVIDQLNRPDVSKAEKELVGKILEGKETITAKELAEGFKREGEGLKLEPRETQSYADYGIDSIGRTTPEFSWEGTQARPVEPRTTIYRSRGMNDANNHFDDPQYFAHARSFDEGGIRHVVEIQSDVAQHAKVLAPEERAKAQESYDLLNHMMKAAKSAQEAINSGRSTIPDYLKAINAYEATWKPDVVYDIKHRLGQRIAEKIDWRNGGPFDSMGWKRLPERGDFDAVYDASKRLLETADRQTRGRLYNDMTYVQQVAAAMEHAYFNETNLLDLRVSEAQAKLGADTFAVQPLLKNWPRRIIREEIAQADGKPVRFATADTVAEVEGWPKFRNGPEAGDLVQPSHQSIYDRYKGDIEKFLKNDLGAKEVTDDLGHTWLEVAPQPRGPVRMFGRSDVKSVAALAALGGGALAMDALQGDDSSLGLDALAGALAATAALGRPRTAVKIAAGSALAAFLSSEENRTRNTVLTGAVLGIAAFAKSRNPTIARWATESTQAAEAVASNISADLRKISPALLRRFTQHERNLKIREHDAMVKIAPLAEGLLKLPEATREAVDIALFNGDRARALKQVADKPDLAKGMQKAFDYIDETGRKLDSLGLVKKLNKEHFPRIVTDLDGLMGALGQAGSDFLGRKLMQAATESIRRSGAPLSDIEMSRVVNEHLAAAVHQSDLGGQAGILKKRSIAEVTKDLLPYYASAADSIALYARSASREIERANFFGKDLIRNSETRGVNVPGSIGQLVANERQAGRLSRPQLERLESILKARFGPGERSGHWLTQTYKNIVYSLLLGNPFSAFVQFGDAAVAAAIHGILPSLKALTQTVTGKAKWSLADQGLINHISEDLIIGARDPLRIGKYEVTSAKFLDKLLKYSGFSFVDEFGKIIHMNAAAAKFEKLARTAKGAAKVTADYGDYFGADLPQLLVDLRNGKKTPLVGELIFRELSDAQPISKLEMPQGYLSNPNARVLYTLKSFMLKQLTLARERGIREIAKGDARSVARGVSFLTRYAIALGLSGATISYIQDWILGREPSFDASDVAENVFKAFGWGEYATREARKGKLLQAGVNAVAPPYKLFEEIWATPDELAKLESGDPKANPKGAMYFPLVGKLIYNRMLGGAERANARKEREARRREREERGF